VLAKKLGFEPDTIKVCTRSVRNTIFVRNEKDDNINQFGDKKIAISKGAPEIILAQCDYYYDGEEKKQLTKR
jgi:magnesium-transporting ATPase (P-type)